MMKELFAVFCLCLPLFVGCNSKRLDELEARLQRASQEHAESLSKLEESRKENRELQLAINSKLDELTREKEAIANLQQALTEDWKKFQDGYDPSMHKTLEEHVESSKKVSDFLAKSQSSTTSTLEELKSHFDRLRTDSNKISEENHKELEKTLTTAKELLEKCREHEASAKNLDVIGKLQSELQRLHGAMKTTEGEITSLETKITSAERMARSAENKASSAERKASSAEMRANRR